MLILKSALFDKYENVVFGFSTKIGLDREAPYYFNMSQSVGDEKHIVNENRDAFFRSLGIEANHVVFQKQIHSDIVKIVEEPGNAGECDAMITSKPGLSLAVSSADCTAVFIYDSQNNVIAGVHSGWRGTDKKILSRTLNLLSENFNSKPENLFAYISPAARQENYEVGQEVADLFDIKYLHMNNGKIYLDVPGANLDLLIKFGIPEKNIEASGLCSVANHQFLHSYRRDGQSSGRAFGVISIKEN